MRDFHLFHFLHPKLKLDEKAEALFEQIHHVMAWFDLLFLEERYERWLIYFYGLIDSLRGEEILELCERLAMNERQKKRAMEGKHQGDGVLLQIFSWINTGREPKRSEIYTTLAPLSTEVKLFRMAKTTQTVTRRYISLYFTQLKDTKTILRGSDLVQLGVRPGPSIRKGLEDLLKARLDEQVATRQDELQYLSKSLKVN